MLRSYFLKFSNNLVINRFVRLFSVDLLARASGFILLPIYLRLMTQGEYGLYGYLLSIIGVFSLVLNFGLYIAQSRLYHDCDSDQRKTLISTINILLFILFTLTIAITYFTRIDYALMSFLFKNPFDFGSYRGTLFLAAVVTVYSFMLNNFLLISERIRLTQLYNISRLVLVNAVVLYLLWPRNGDSVMIRLKYSYIIESLVVLSIGSVYFSNFVVRFSKTYALAALKLGLPVMFSAFIGLFINFADRFFIEKWGTFSDLGVYNLALTVSSILTTVFSSLQNVWLPLFLKEKMLDTNYRRTKKLAFQITAIFIILSFVLFLVLKMALIFRVVDAHYSKALVVLPILSATQIVVALTGITSNYLVYFNMTYVVAIVGTGLGVLSVGMNLLLVPYFGMYGAASAALITNIFYLLIYYGIVHAKIKSTLRSSEMALALEPSPGTL